MRAARCSGACAFPATTPTWPGATTTGVRCSSPPITASIAPASIFPAWRSGKERSMAWQFELVAGPYEGPTGGVVRDGDAVIFSAIDEGRLLGFDPKTNA